MSVGFVLVAPFAFRGHVQHLPRLTVTWLILSGAGNVAGLLLTYLALRGGDVTVVAPLLSTEGAIAALFAVAGGERLAPAAGLALLVVAIGVVLVASETPQSAGLDGAPRRRAILLALTAAVCFGASLYATGKASAVLPLGLALLPPRLVGVVAVALPLAATRRWQMTPLAWPLVVLGGACEVGGAVAFAVGARHGLAVSAVLGSQFATVAVVAGVVLFRERMTRRQIGGVGAVALGIAVLSGLQA